MTNQNMAFLYSGGIRRRYNHGVIAQGSYFAAVISQQAHGDQARFFSGMNCRNDVAAVAAGGNAYQNIPWFSERLDLAGKYVLEAVIVSYRGQY